LDQSARTNKVSDLKPSKVENFIFDIINKYHNYLRTSIIIVRQKGKEKNEK